MDVALLARAQSLNRVTMGTGLVLAPGVAGRVWVGAAARQARPRVLARAMGVRDLTLGVAGLLAAREGDRVWECRSFAAQALADAVDAVAILGAGDRVPLSSRAVGGSLAAGSAAVAAAHAMRLRGPSGS